MPAGARSMHVVVAGDVGGVARAARVLPAVGDTGARVAVHGVPPGIRAVVVLAEALLDHARPDRLLERRPLLGLGQRARVGLGYRRGERSPGRSGDPPRKLPPARAP